MKISISECFSCGRAVVELGGKFVTSHSNCSGSLKHVVEAEVSVFKLREAVGLAQPLPAVPQATLKMQDLWGKPDGHQAHCSYGPCTTCDCGWVEEIERRRVSRRVAKRMVESGSQPAQPSPNAPANSIPQFCAEPAQPATPAEIRCPHDLEFYNCDECEDAAMPFREGTRPDPKDARCEKCYFLGVPCAGLGSCGCACHNKAAKRA